MFNQTNMLSETSLTPNAYNNHINTGFNDNLQCFGEVHAQIDPDNLLSSSRYLALQGERLLNAFASLMSSVQAFSLEEPIIPKSKPALARLLSSNVTFNRCNPYSHHTCSFPSLSIRNSIPNELNEEKLKLSMKDKAAMNLAFPCFVDHSDAETAPVTLIENFTSSFMTLIKSRLRTSLAALFGNKSGLDSNEAILLMKLLTGGLSCSSPATLTAAVTSFRTLPMAANVEDPSLLYLPLVYEAIIDITVLGKLVSVKLSAPGTITGVINEEDGLLDRVEILFDTISLLQAMSKQARYVVRQAISRAAGIAYQMTSTSGKTSVSMNNSNVNSKVYPDKTTSRPSKYNPSRKIKADTTSEYKMFSWLVGEHNLYTTNAPSSGVPDKALSGPILKQNKDKSIGNEEMSDYKLFSWLAGDEMLLNNDEQNLYTTNGGKCNVSSLSEYNHISCKKRKVSFCINQS